MPDFYSEKMMEDFIRDYPEIFLEEGLVFLAQQLRIEGFIPDLIFKDREDKILIVEVQLNALDRKHLYKTLEYKDLYKIKYQVDHVRIMVVCNELPEKYVPILHTHKIESKIISREYFIKTAKDLNPLLEFETEIAAEILEEEITINAILKLIRSKKTEVNQAAYDATVFYYYPGFETEQYNKYFYRNLNGTGADEMYWHQLPYELIVNNRFFACINEDKIEMILEWLTILNSYINVKTEGEIILGYRSSPDYFDYDSYLKGFMAKFGTLCIRYHNDNHTYNHNKLIEDLSFLNEGFIYFGNNSDCRLVPLFSGFSIEKNGGRLEKQREEKFFKIAEFNRLRGVKEEDIQKYIDDEKRDAERLEFVTVYFAGFNKQVADALEDLCMHMRNRHYDYTKQRIIVDRCCARCITTPVQFKNIPEDALLLTNKYFNHYFEDRYAP